MRRAYQLDLAVGVLLHGEELAEDLDSGVGDLLAVGG